MHMRRSRLRVNSDKKSISPSTFDLRDKHQNALNAVSVAAGRGFNAVVAIRHNLQDQFESLYTYTDDMSHVY